MPHSFPDLLALCRADTARVFADLSPAALTEAALARREAQLTETGALVARTGAFTGRSPKDKFLVDDAETHDRVDWGPVNQPLTPAQFDGLLARMTLDAREGDLFVFNGFAGADPAHRLPIRIITRYAWHSLFAHQLFLRATPAELAAHSPAFTLLDLPGFHADPGADGTRSSTVIALDMTRRIGLIGGTEYAGEIKKSIFTVMNYLLPLGNVLPMHCSANVGDDGRSALFFGLSGTGKTTLSADPARRLVGDDEHGWSETGVFNIEGGCYAKCIHLSRAGEPQIWDAITFGAVLENVVVDAETRRADYDDASLTENTRAAYPVDAIPNAVIPGVSGHPSILILLTADAFGVLPPVARLTPDQAMYHFLSGYTSKLAGTERGVTTPEPNFSACFGAPFWPLPPTRYAQMLGEKLAAHQATCFLVNTGWSGGPYGEGKRMDLALTRRMVEAALSGALSQAPTTPDPIFGLHVPQQIDGIPDTLLQPRQTWADPQAYDTAARALARRFADNFRRFPDVSAAIQAAGPVSTAL